MIQPTCFWRNVLMRFCGLYLGVACLLAGFCFPAFAAKTWKNNMDGFWRDGTNWSGNIPPDSTSYVQIDNTNTETITIDSLTDSTNLTVSKITLSAPAGYTNTIYLNNVTNGPLICTVGLELMDGAFLRLTNSALLLTLTNDHVNIDGNLNLESGSINFGDTTVTARVGRVTSGTFTMNSGSVFAGAITVGGLTNSSGFINMNGGIFNISSLFSIGRNLGTTGTVVVAGGQLFASKINSRIGDSGIGQLIISNAGVVLTNVDIGRDALSAGTLNVQTGGVMTCLGDVALARFAGALGSLFVTGGQFNASGRKISVGEEGSGQLILSSGVVQAATLGVADDPTNTATGLLNVSGGSLNLSSNLFVGGVSNSSGQVSLGGGAITVTNQSGTANIIVANGNLTFNSGTLTTDRLFLTNGSGHFVFNGGTLVVRSTAVTNGLPFVVGNGVTPATLYLNGGTHAFANGLVISSNATLAGCGTILGTVTNRGTLAMTCGGSLVRPSISSLVKTGVTNTLSFTSASNQTYVLEYKNNLTDAIWTPIPPSLSGNGGVLKLLDTTATNATRFYHVHTQ